MVLSYVIKIWPIPPTVTDGNLHQSARLPCNSHFQVVVTWSEINGYRMVRGDKLKYPLISRLFQQGAKSLHPPENILADPLT